MAAVETRNDGNVAILTIDNPPVNALGHAVRVGLSEGLAKALADPAVKAIVVTGAGRAFSAGADITEFRSGMKEPGLGTVIDAIEASPKTVVAAINGLALGGGLEVTLGCHYRVAAKSVAQLGLPEVKIGILPGAGGTQRLPRAIGVAPALDMIVSGAPIGAEAAAKAGLVDKIVDGDVVAAAIAYARELVAAGKGPRPTGARAIDPATNPPGLFDKKRGEIARHPSGPMAPRNCIACVEAATKLPIKEGLVRERELFKELAGGPNARALQYAFFAERQAANIPDIGADVKPRPVKSVGILGAGTMGVGIGLAVLSAGLPLILVETSQAALDKGVGRIRETIEGNVKRGRLTAADAEARLKSLTATLDLAKLAGADLIIEAVFENMGVKKEVFAKLDAVAKPGAILATNTSTLDVDEIARATKRPGDVIGLHFFSPANIMRLLEIVRGKATSKDVLATAMAFARKIGKVGVVAGVCFGFIGNRMLEAYLEEAQAMMLEGASPRDIDAAIEAWGFAMGPNAMMDLAGLDVGYRIRKEHALSPERAALYAVTDRIVEMGRHGQKTGAGMYLYAAGDRKGQPDPKIAEMFRAEAE
ncbi:MAG TPA: 3-hydroxyacyl-CoA dehydrogenase NAD-binding domain-containing protein, partial [Hyphomicrobiaceae bacterium]|nr:3-hydroxyacyl-CoA dehydrogenase NAD-binding domain-containing protein [Hyphomicrobiaceae bacterium]